jgi:hypothetical protein
MKYNPFQCINNNGGQFVKYNLYQTLFILFSLNFALFSENNLSNHLYLNVNLSNQSNALYQVAQLSDNETREDANDKNVETASSLTKDSLPGKKTQCVGIQISNVELPKIRLKTHVGKSKRIDLRGTTPEELCQVLGTTDPSFTQVLGLHPSALKEYKKQYPYLVGMYGGISAVGILSIIEFTKTLNDANNVNKGNLSGQRGFEIGPVIAMAVSGFIACGSILMVSHHYNKAISGFNNKQTEIDVSKPSIDSIGTAISSVSAQGAESSSDCIPPCRDSLKCVNGRCVKTCNPPCPSGTQCDSTGNCVSKSMPIRDKKKICLSAEIPWNGLVGVGLVGTYRPFTHLSLDGGVGYSSFFGMKYGFRGRYCFMQTAASPFLGLGYTVSSGIEGVSKTINNTNITYDTKSLKFLQISTGMDWVTSRGFTLLLSIGMVVKSEHESIQNVRYNGMTYGEFSNTPNFNNSTVSSFYDYIGVVYANGVLTLGLGFSF